MAGIGNAMEAPAQESMDLGGGVMVYQTTSQCCRCCCCQPNIDWSIHDYDDNWNHEKTLPTKMIMKEDAAWCGRCMSFCCPAARATTYTVTSAYGGNVLFKHEKPWTCSNCPLVMVGDSGPIRAPWCCCLPYLETKDANGTLLGTSKYICDAYLCVPKYEVLDSTGSRVYLVRPEICCLCCPRCRCLDGGCKGGKCFRVPFPIREPNPPYNQIKDASITDLWAGMKHECCTNKEMYSIKFPENMSSQTKNVDAIKKTLIGTTLLVDLSLNEQDQ